MPSNSQKRPRKVRSFSGLFADYDDHTITRKQYEDAAAAELPRPRCTRCHNSIVFCTCPDEFHLPAAPPLPAYLTQPWPEPTSQGQLL